MFGQLVGLEMVVYDDAGMDCVECAYMNGVRVRCSDGIGSIRHLEVNYFTALVVTDPLARWL